MKLKLNPLQQAIVDNNVQLAEKLITEKRYLEKDAYGFTPFELACFLGKPDIQKLFVLRKPKTLKIQLQDQPSPALFRVHEYEKIFDVIYRPYLTFSSYESFSKTIDNCPYFYKYQWLFGRPDEWESDYQELLAKGYTAKTLIKWVSPEMGYGLFADEEIAEKNFVGEYTGLIRQVDKKDPDLNDYCAHYPTKFFSLNYFMIDAMPESNELRFINHSDKPNLLPIWMNTKGMLHLVFIAGRDIEKGEELTFDYGKDYWQKRKKLMF